MGNRPGEKDTDRKFLLGEDDFSGRKEVKYSANAQAPSPAVRQASREAQARGGGLSRCVTVSGGCRDQRSEEE